MTTKNEHSMTTTTTQLLRPTDLADILTGLVDRPQQWMERVRLESQPPLVRAPGGWRRL